MFRNRCREFRYGSGREFLYGELFDSAVSEGLDGVEAQLKFKQRHSIASTDIRVQGPGSLVSPDACTRHRYAIAQAPRFSSGLVSVT